MGRKVFISVLGTGFYGKCKYVNSDANFVSEETRFVQTSIMKYIGVSEWNSDDVALFLLTDLARSKNWSKNITERIDGQGRTESYVGLEKELQDIGFPLIIKDVPIPDGKDEAEMWRIFDVLYSHLNEGDELYFDLTHSFRYIPMLVLILGNYAKFLKNVAIESITYGNFEARDKELNEAPIVDLLPLVKLQDWTYAAGQYVDNGSVKDLVALSEQEIKPILKATNGKDVNAYQLNGFVKRLSNVIDDFLTCRGESIVESDNISKLKQSMKDVEQITIKPLTPIFEKIENSIKDFDENSNVRNGFLAADWCLNNGQYQQSATILQETIVSFFCERCGIDICDEDARHQINEAFRFLAPDYENAPQKEQNLIYAVLAKDSIVLNTEIVEIFSSLTEVRNDINHAGMRKKQKPFSSNYIRQKIAKYVVKCKEIFCLC